MKIFEIIAMLVGLSITLGFWSVVGAFIVVMIIALVTAPISGLALVGMFVIFLGASYIIGMRAI